MDRLERALVRFETVSDRRLSRLEGVVGDLQRTVGGLEGVVGKLAVQVTAFVESQKEFNATITTALKTYDRRVDQVSQTVDRLARTVDRFLRTRANGHNGR